jgi:hypothetical protein
MSKRESEEQLSDEEIEAILERENALAAEAHEAPQEPKVVQREPGQGRFGKWAVWLIIAFILLGALQMMRR